MVKTLTITETILLEKNPELLKIPINMGSLTIFVF